MYGLLFLAMAHILGVLVAGVLRSNKELAQLKQAKESHQNLTPYVVVDEPALKQAVDKHKAAGH